MATKNASSLVVECPYFSACSSTLSTEIIMSPNISSPVSGLKQSAKSSSTCSKSDGVSYSSIGNDNTSVGAFHIAVLFVDLVDLLVVRQNHIHLRLIRTALVIQGRAYHLIDDLSHGIPNCFLLRIQYLLSSVSSYW